MPHPEYRALIDASNDDALSEAERQRLAAHTAQCLDCSTYEATAMRDVAFLREAMEPTQAPAEFTERVLAATAAVPIHRPRSWSRAVIAGIAGNVMTSVMLILLSLGANASLGLMVIVAIGGGLVWGAAKGLIFGGLLRLLPTGAIGRGLVFGLALWAVTNAALGVVGGLGSSSLSLSFLLAGSLVHDLIYGLLISGLYSYLSSHFSGATR